MRRKLDHYKYSEEANNVIQAGKPLYQEVKGNWNRLYFKNEAPVIVELACGKGEYTVGLGAKFPNRNFIGMDIKGDRIARGSKLASDLNLSNVAFLRAGIQYSDEFFSDGELSEIWLIHPDPQQRDKEEKKRLTNPSFLTRYAQFLKKGGLFCLKTDSSFLYDYTLETLDTFKQLQIVEHTPDLYASHLLEDHHGVQTHYERIFTAKGHSIKYIKAQVI
ncbi:tRNA (guanosine(46)-N7)-methyltransferase TrmB [Dyadobacter sandarakinus]|uniref:tRNA (guanine-N(7)-)-methyltransferase n=1 Tax=Dyadobacter sandarakinus TaxID=2747268 RepID=A0ABX7I3Y7_9BACT|nr:tRNA (guanosine(46)-N7)-methyltransferase TrmB [Dyadobacter sandarakinus]QRR00448.1 tRNA (guanosine(46)-N7)-methyltransferase TrmB [Dyadobacter sandarakinus]